MGDPGGSLPGRAGDLELGRHLLHRADQGHPQVLLLSGEAGIGKSHLARAISAEAVERGATSLWGSGQEELTLPYLPILTALSPLVDSVGDGSSADPAEAADLWNRLTTALLGSARRRCTVLTIDDLQWTDASTQALLLHLVGAADHAATQAPIRLLTIVTVRSPYDSDGPVARTVSRLRREPLALSVELGGLDRVELRDHLARTGPAPPSRSVLHRIERSTGGNPLLAQSVLRRGLDERRLRVERGQVVGDPDDELPTAPDELDRAVAERLRDLSRPCIALLTLAALLGDDQPLEELGAIAALEAPTVLALIDEAIDADLVRDVGGRCSFAHPQVRHVLFNRPRRRERQALHLRIADALEARHGDDATAALAHHLVRAGALVPPERVVRWSRQAATQARDLAAWAEAGIAAQQALAAGGASLRWDEAADLHLLATEAASYDFDVATARVHGLATIELSRAHGDRERWGHAVLALTRTLVGTDAEGVAALPLVEELLAAEPPARPELRAELLGVLSEILAAANRTDAALAAAARARSLLDDATEPRVVAAVHVAEGMARWARLELDEATAAFHAAADRDVDPTRAPPLPSVFAMVRLNLVRHLAGDAAGALEGAGAAAARLAGLQSWAEHGLAAASATTAALALGRLDEVERWGALAERSVVRSGYRWPCAVYLPAVAQARALQGDRSGGLDAVDQLRDVAGPGTRARYAAVVDLLLGDHEPVTALLAARPWNAPPGPLTMPTLPSAVLHAEAMAAAGPPEAAALAAGHLAEVHAGGTRVGQGWVALLSRLIGACHQRAGDAAAAEGWLRVAAEEAGQLGLRVELGRTELALARLEAETAREPRSAERARRAARTLDRAGALPLAASARMLGRSDATTGPARRVILFTDLVGSTALNVRAGDEGYVQLLQEHDQVVRRALRDHRGVEFKHTGDGVAAWFSDALDAVRCVDAISDHLARASILHPELPLQVRAGIAAGEPIGAGGDLFGLAVVHAARLCASASPDEVLVTEEVADACRTLRFEPRSALELKGLPGPMVVRGRSIGARRLESR